MLTPNIKQPMSFSSLFQRRRYESPARTLYESIVGQSRRSEFFTSFGIPDNVPGRFDMIAIHAWLVMRRLKKSTGTDTAPARALSQALFDLMFADMDQNLREMGVGDLSVGKKIKAMAQGFYGRVAAYDGGLEQGETVLRDALLRNLFATGEPTPRQVSAMVHYLQDADAALSRIDAAGLLSGQVRFPSPPALD